VDVSNLLSRLSELELKVVKGVSDDLGPPPSDLLTHVDLLDSLVRDLIFLLENRVVGAGVKMGDLVFQSFKDLLSWVKVKLPSGRFRFIVDGHSFLEFLLCLLIWIPSCLLQLRIMLKRQAMPFIMR
jgi:hypothetical protein